MILFPTCHNLPVYYLADITSKFNIALKLKKSPLLFRHDIMKLERAFNLPQNKEILLDCNENLIFTFLLYINCHLNLYHERIILDYNVFII